MAFFGATFSPRANADEWNKRTVVTFSGPVEIPGVHLEGWGILPAGTYVFKLLDSSSDRHIVQIFNQDETIIYATILAIPNYRLKATDKTVITFNEGVSDRPEALRAWFYPGANSGEEFVYPKAKAVELAKVTQTPVLAVVADLKAEVAKPDEPQVVEELKQVPLMAVKPTGEVVDVAEVVQTTPPATVDPTPAIDVAAPVPTQVPENTLPGTARFVPLVTLLGFLALSGAVTIRAIRNRVA
jgi:hypothetical protein